MNESPSSPSPHAIGPTPGPSFPPIGNRKSTIENPPGPHAPHPIPHAFVPDDAIPIPPRYWWLKRITIATAGLLVFLIALRLWWGWVADRRLQAEIDRIVAAGEPIFPEDFNPKEKIPDEENAVKVLERAAATLTLTTADERLLDGILERPSEVAQLEAELLRLHELNRPALELASLASTMPKCDWGTRYQTPAVAYLCPSYTPQRQVSKFVCGMAVYQHGIGDDHESLELLLDALAQGRSISSEPSLIGQLVSIAISGLVTRQLEVMVPTLRIEPEYTSVQTAPGFATRQQAVKLLKALLDQSMHRTGFHRAIMTERMSILDSASLCAKSSTGLGFLYGTTPLAYSVLGVLASPLFLSDGLFALRMSTSLVEAARDETYPRRVADTFKSLGLSTPAERILRPVSSIMFPSLERSFVLQYRVMTTRRMAGIALAIRLFQVDHGRRPTQLEELVPQYLPEIPADPFSTGDHPIRYLPTAARPILYSVGSDGVDDQGRFQLRRTGAIDWDHLDIPFFLNGDRYDVEHAVDPNSGASTQSSQDDNQTADDEQNPRDENQGQSEP